MVSVFLPVVIGKDSTGWKVDWDHENLLSMSTHLRVTRVGTPRIRPPLIAGPEDRPIIEQLLRPFNCVPVWVDPIVFNEHYNGFCKGILWPVFHNVSTIYNLGGVDADGGLDPGDLPKDGAEVEVGPEVVRGPLEDADSLMPGPIHGDGGQQAALWTAYTQVNKAFSDTIIQQFNEGDLIWIHGFHLLILPSILSRKVGRLSKIGLFLHTPFPSSEIFRTLWCREDLLRGMLNADQVGFHLYEYARHFLTCCRRLLGLTYGMSPDAYGGHNLAVDTAGRSVTITSIHAGVDAQLLNKTLAHPTTAERVAEIKEQFKGKVVMVAIDRLENLKGAPLKILGLERFLDKRPEYVGRIVLVQVGISALERGDDYINTRKEVLRLVNNVNGKYPGTIQFQECNEPEMRLPQRMALLRAADIAIVTSLRDGLNRLPLEFSIAHQDALGVGIKNYADYEEGVEGAVRVRPGICILSEFASCARVMRGSIHVNPWKLAEIAHAIECSLRMDVEEHRRRIKYDSEFVTRVTTQRWALAVLMDLKSVKKNVTHGQYSGAGLGLGFRLLGMDTGFYSLDTGAVAKAYRNSSCRLLVLDYGGTLVSSDKNDNVKLFSLAKKAAKRNTPHEDLINELTQLCSDPRNTVFVVSGKERGELIETLGSVPNLGLAAEHGMFYSWPHHQTIGGSRKWERLVSGQDRSWRSSALTIMEVYCSRTHGSYIEETESKILWQYRDADPEFGALQSKEMEDHLVGVLKNFSVEILRGGEGGQGGGYIEVRPKGVDKGVLLRRVLESLGGGGGGHDGDSEGEGGDERASTESGGPHSALPNPPLAPHKKVDFALVVGDDNCDEPMFDEMRGVGRALRDNIARAKSGRPVHPNSTLENVNPSIKYYTCTVGKKPSEAANFLNDVEEVHELLHSLNKVSTRQTKYNSSIDLMGMGSGRFVGSMEAGSTQPTLSDPKVPSHLEHQSKILGGLGFEASNQTISSGLTRSMSLGNFARSGSEAGEGIGLLGGAFGVGGMSGAGRKQQPVSMSLNEFLVTIDDGEGEGDDENFF